MLKKTLGFLIIFIVSIIFAMNISLAEEETSQRASLDDIIDVLSNLSCETQGVGNLLRSEFSHTCIPAPFFNYLVANILSPGLYPSMMLRLKINDDELFPESCTKANRIDPNDRKISFALCNNSKLIAARVEAVFNAAVTIAGASLTGQDPWESIADVWMIDKASYHQIYLDQKVGDDGVMADIGSFPVFPWKIIESADKLCVATVGFLGFIPVGCKYMNEPYPVSIYSDFMDIDNSSPQAVSHQALSLTSCATMGSCYKRARENSKVPLVMTGPLVECIREMVVKLTISNQVCHFSDLDLVASTSARESSSLFQFQKNMHKAVSALLTLYVIFFGFRMILSGNTPKKSELVNFVLKFLFVIYFSVGININSSNDPRGVERLDGLVQWLLPFLVDGMMQLSSWVVNASPSGLCVFSPSEYQQGLGHMALWDALDCKVSHYIGLDVLQNFAAGNAFKQYDGAKMDFFSFPIPPYVYLLIPAIMSGYPTLIGLVLMYPLLVISVAAFVVNSTVVCMICIVILAIMAPIFVPMLLFQFTKGYFDSWLKLLISFMLQPMILVTFMTTMLAVYDYGFYGSCKYAHKDFTMPNSSIKRVFYLDNNWSLYPTAEEVDSCQKSIGYMLNNPWAAMAKTITDLNEDFSEPTEEKDREKFEFLNGVAPEKGAVANAVTVVYEKIMDLITALIKACFTLYLMYHFSESLSSFAADMTGGISTSGMTGINAQDVAKGGQKGVKMASEAMAEDGDGDGGGGDKGGGNSGEGGDKGQGDDKGSEDVDSDSAKTGGSNVISANDVVDNIKGDSKKKDEDA